jgi:ABC-type nickel/cobalt efflux system permease component RcnA
MSRAGGWSNRKTLVVTALCGVGHVGSSVVLGFLGIALGIAMNRLEGVEESRAALAAWLLIGFGLAYLTWGIVRAVRARTHSHVHVHSDGAVHAHPHQHHSGHLHSHDARPAGKPDRMTPWILFTIFIFGPCEPLIPLVMYPAAENSVSGVAIVTLLFSLATLLTMTLAVRLLVGGFNLLRFSTWVRFGDALAGGVVLACGMAVKFGL